MYYEARTDRKLATLSDHEFRVWFNLLCFAAEQDERGIIPESDDYMLGIEVGAADGPDLRLILDKLERLRIVSRAPDWDAENYGNEDEYGYQFGVVTFIHFDDRNHDKPSDHPDRVNERVKRHRQSKKEGETPSNADVTPRNAHVTPKIRGDRDKSREEENGSLSFATANAAKTKRATAIPEDFVVTDEMTNWAFAEQFTYQDIEQQTALFRDHFTGNGKPMKDWSATWRAWMRRSRTYDRAPKTSNGFGPKGPDAEWFAKQARDLERQGL
jgi:hypothetical protein